MAARQPIGQVYIRVSPDTSGFAGETRRELKKLKSLDKQETKVQIGLDTEQLREDFDDAIASLQLQALDEDFRIHVFTDLAWSAGEYRRQIKEQVSKYQALADGQRVDIKTNLDDTITGGEAISRTVNLDIDQADFQKDLNKVLESAKSKLKVGVDTKSIAEEIKDTAREVRTIWDMAFRKDKLKLDIDVNAADLEIVEEQLHKVRNAYAGDAEIIEASARELKRVTAEYTTISTRISRMQREMEKINQDTESGAEAYEAQAIAVDKLIDRQRILLGERIRLMDVGRDANVRLELDRESVVALEAEYEELQRSLEMKTAEIGVGISEIDFRTVATRLAALARTRVALIVTAMTPASRKAIDGLQKIGLTNWSRIGSIIGGFAGRTTGIRLLYQTARDMLDIVPKLDMMIPKLATTLGVAAPLVSAAGAAIGSAISIGADALKAAQAVLIAPAGLAGMVTIGAVLYAAFSDLNKVLPSVEKRFSALRDVASDSFWSTGKPQIASFFDTLLTSLEKWTPAVAKRVGEATGALADGLREGLDTHADRFFTNLNKGLKAAEGGFKSFGSAFMGLIGAGSDSFEELGTWFTGVMGDFDAWVKKNDANGNLTRWINEAGQALRDIGSVIYSVGSMFQSLSQIVKDAGGPSLSSFAAGMRELRDIFASDVFQSQAAMPMRAMFDFVKNLGDLKPKALTAIMTAADLLTYSLYRLAEPVEDILGGILDGFNDPKFSRGWEQFVDGIGSFLSEITPGIQRFTTELGGLFGIVGEGAKSFAPAFNELLLLVSNIGANIHPGLEDFLKFIGPELEDLVKAVGPGLEDMATGISDILANKGFQDFLSDVFDKLKIIVPALEDVVNGILDLTDALFDDYDELPDWMQDLASWAVAIGGITIAVGGLVTKILAPFKGAIRAITAGLGRIFMAGGLGRILRPILARFIGFLSGPVGWGLLLASIIRPTDAASFADWVVDALGFEDSWLGRFTEALKRRFGEVFGEKSLLDLAIESIGEAWGKLTDGDWQGAIKELFTGNPIDLIGAIADALLESLGLDDDLASMQERWPEFFGEGGVAGFFNNFWDGLKRAITLGLAQLWMKMSTWKPVQSIVDFGKWLWGKVKEFLFGGEGKVSSEPPAGSMSAELDFGTSWGNSIRGALQDSWDKLVSLVRNWAPVNAVIEFFQNPWGKIKEWLGIGSGWPSSSPAGGMGGVGIELGNWGSSIWTGTIQPWLDMGWKTLLSWVNGWQPVQAVVAFFQDPIGTVMGWLGIGEGWPLSGGGGGLGDAGFALGEGLGNWGSSIWTGTIKPWLDQGWTSLTTSINGWAPGGEEGGEGSSGVGGNVIQRVLGLMAPNVAAIAAQLGAIGGAISSFGATVRAHFTVMATTVAVTVSTMVTTVVSTVTSMATRVASGIVSMASRAIAGARSMATGIIAQAGSMASRAVSAARSMATGVIAQAGSMASRAVSAARSMATGIIGQARSAASGAVNQARSMATGFVSQISSMASRALSIARNLRSALPGAVRADLSGPGQYAGSTFANGLRRALDAAVSAARAIVGRIRSALRFSAYGSGSSIGSTFASGLKSMIGTVGSAAAGLVSAARSKLPNSPADDGPFSGSGWGGWGESIGEELAKGLRSTIPLVSREAERMTQAVSGSLSSLESTPVGVNFRRGSLAALNEGYEASTESKPIVNVNVESSSDDPMQDGRRLGADLVFAMRGAGLA